LIEDCCFGDNATPVISHRITLGASHPSLCDASAGSPRGIYSRCFFTTLHSATLTVAPYSGTSLRVEIAIEPK
jgi:hypothetical protein